MQEAKDKTLKKWRTAKQAESRERIAKAIDLFSVELMRIVDSTASQEKVKPKPRHTQTWEDKATIFAEEVKWHD